MEPGIEGKVALVTGGSSGSGKETARQLLEEGATVVILARRPDVLEEARQELSQYGRVESRICDVTDLAAYEALIQQVAVDHGSLEILVNNAGDAVPGLAAHGTPRSALQQLSSFAAIEGAPYGVRVDAVQAGAVIAPASEQWGQHDPNHNEKVSALQRLLSRARIAATKSSTPVAVKSRSTPLIQ